MIGPRAWFLLALAVLVLTVYAGVSNHSFVYFDDGAYLFQNGWTGQGFTAATVWHMLTTTTGGQYLPVTMISYLPLVSIFGMEAGPQVWFNVAVHMANCLLVVWVLHTYTGWFWRSACVAMLLALHPIHVESVAWATERKDVLFMFFGLLSLGAYAHYARKPSALKLALVVGLYGLSMLSKAMLVTMPALLLLLDAWPLKRIALPGSPVQTGEAPGLAQAPEQPVWKLLAEKVPFALIGIAMAIITIKFTPVANSQRIPIDLKLGVALMGYIDYLIMLVWPVNLCGLYPMPQVLDKVDVAIRMAMILCVTGIGVWQFKKRPYILIGWLWYVGTLTPVSGIMQAGTQARADRFVYWPFLGIYVAVVWLGWELLANWARRGKPADGAGIEPSTLAAAEPAQGQDVEGLPRPVAVAGLIGLGVLACVLWTLSVRQVSYWQDSETFFGRIIDVTPKNAQAHGALGVYLVDQRRLDDAEGHFLKALEYKPGDVGSLTALANIALMKGQAPLTLALLEKALASPLPYKEDASSAALMLHQLGQRDRAMEVATKALENDPRNVLVRTNAGVIFVSNGKPQEGLALLYSALNDSPNDPGILVNLGSAYGNLGQLDKAQQAFEAAVRAKPGDLRPYAKLGKVYLITGRPAQAKAAFEAGLAIDPADPECLHGLKQLQDSAGGAR